MSWNVIGTTEEDLGYFRIYVTAPGGNRTEVTWFRNAPSELINYSSADPFGDATAQLQFQQISVLDDLGSGDLDWFVPFADVDIELYNPTSGTSVTVFEGFFVSYDWESSDSTTQVTVTCQGALYEVDGLVAFPEYPAQPIANEVLMAQAFSPHSHPTLRSRPLAVEWPENWKLLAYTATDIIGAQIGSPSTGFKTRVTGGWEKQLTGYIASLLQTMYTTDFADQWTVRKDPGRQPVLCIRFASRPADFSVYAGQPGVSVNLARDYSQFANVLYGSGTSLDGSQWSRQSVDPITNLTSYVPMAADPKVYPENAPTHDPTVPRRETYLQFEQGMEETTALKSAQTILRKNQDPGYAGTISLTIDPVELPRWLISAGMTVRLKYFAGTGSDGISLHITQVSADVSGGSVELTVDSLYRDALTVDQALARTRDPLTPIKMLQVGKQSILIPDQMAPWSYTLGSGFLPKGATGFFSNGTDTPFPYDDQVAKMPPKAHPNFYVPINAAAPTSDGRWAAAVPIRMAEKGTIRLTQIALYDRDGKRVNIPFHVSFYYSSGISVGNMPMDQNTGLHSPFIPGAFLSQNQYGLSIPAGSAGAITQADQSLVMGWGTGDQPAGYSPGTKTNGDLPTGLLIDETSWSFDCTTNPDFQQNPSSGYVQLESAITIYAMLYAEYHDWVYAIGRLYYQPAGIN